MLSKFADRADVRLIGQGAECPGNRGWRGGRNLQETVWNAFRLICSCKAICGGWPALTVDVRAGQRGVQQEVAGDDLIATGVLGLVEG